MRNGDCRKAGHRYSTPTDFGAGLRRLSCVRCAAVMIDLTDERPALSSTPNLFVNTNQRVSVFAARETRHPNPLPISALDRSAISTSEQPEATAIASTQGGVITRRQTDELGLTPGQIDEFVAEKNWAPIGNLGYRLEEVSGHIESCRAGVALLPSAVVSHQTAAELHGFDLVATGMAVVTVVSGSNPADLPGLTINRTRDLAPAHQTVVGGLPVTTIARTAIDLSTVLASRHFEAVVDRLLARRMVTLDELGAVATAVCRRGKKGSAAVRSYLASRLNPPSGSTIEKPSVAIM